jgi:hypothetical protein
VLVAETSLVGIEGVLRVLGPLIERTLSGVSPSCFSFVFACAELPDSSPGVCSSGTTLQDNSYTQPMHVLWEWNPLTVDQISVSGGLGALILHIINV